MVVGRRKSRKVVGRIKKSKGREKGVVVRTSVGTNFGMTSVSRISQKIFSCDAPLELVVRRRRRRRMRRRRLKVASILLKNF